VTSTKVSTHCPRAESEINRTAESGSSSYVPREKDKDTQLKYGLDLLRRIRSVDTDNNRKTEAI
jgi:carboxyl-terminal processing protease